MAVFFGDLETFGRVGLRRTQWRGQEACAELWEICAEPWEICTEPWVTCTELWEICTELWDTRAERRLF